MGLRATLGGHWWATIAVGPEIQLLVQRQHGPPVDFVANQVGRGSRVSALQPELSETDVPSLVDALRQLPDVFGVQLALGGPIWYETECRKRMDGWFDNDPRVRIANPRADIHHELVRG